MPRLRSHHPERFGVVPLLHLGPGAVVPMTDAIDEEMARLREENRRLRFALDLIYKTSQRQRTNVELATRNVKPCKHLDCDKRARANGYCDTHYRMARRLEAAAA